MDEEGRVICGSGRRLGGPDFERGVEGGEGEGTGFLREVR